MEKKLKILRELQFRLASFDVFSAEKGRAPGLETWKAMLDTFQEIQKGKTENLNKKALSNLKARGFIDENDQGKIQIKPDLNIPGALERLKLESTVATQNKEIQNIIQRMGGCVCCHKTNTAEIEFHHINPKGFVNYNNREGIEGSGFFKKETGDSVRGIGWSELIKTVPLCRDCHDEISRAQNPDGEVGNYEVAIPREILNNYWENTGRDLMRLFLIGQDPNFAEPDMKAIDAEWKCGVRLQCPDRLLTQENISSKLDKIANISIRDSRNIVESINKRIDQLQEMGTTIKGTEKTHQEENTKDLNRRIEKLQSAANTIIKEGLKAATNHIQSLGIENTEDLLSEVQDKFSAMRQPFDSLEPEQGSDQLPIDQNATSTNENQDIDKQTEKLLKPMQDTFIKKDQENESIKSLLTSLAPFIPASMVQGNPELQSILTQAQQMGINMELGSDETPQPLGPSTTESTADQGTMAPNEIQKSVSLMTTDPITIREKEAEESYVNEAYNERDKQQPPMIETQDPNAAPAMM